MRPSLYRRSAQFSRGPSGRLAHALLLAAAALVYGSNSVDGQVTASECCLSLLFPLGARSVGLGQALTARTSIDGLFYNPASLANVAEDQFIAHHETTFIGQNNAFTVFVDAGLAGAFGLSYLLVDEGEFPALDDNQQQTGTFNIRHTELIASYATRLAGGLRAGVNLKLFNSGVFCSGRCTGATSGTTHLIDLGVQLKPPSIGSLELGASIVQFGLPLQAKNAEQADPTPARLRIGGAYEIAHHFWPDSLVTLWISSDVVNRLRSPTTPVVSIGAEVAFEEALFLRAGYAQSGDALASGGIGLGVGIRYKRFTIGVSKAFSVSEFDSGSDRFQVSFGVTF
jgi:hypothetical protein